MNITVLIGVACLVSGFIGGYLFCKRGIDKKIEAKIKDEIANIQNEIDTVEKQIVEKLKVGKEAKGVIENGLRDIKYKLGKKT